MKIKIKIKITPPFLLNYTKASSKEMLHGVEWDSKNMWRQDTSVKFLNINFIGLREIHFQELEGQDYEQ